jgi:hypothetical protein
MHLLKQNEIQSLNHIQNIVFTLSSVNVGEDIGGMSRPLDVCRR